MTDTPARLTVRLDSRETLWALRAAALARRITLEALMMEMISGWLRAHPST